MSIKKTSLYDLHLASDAKLVEFANTWLPMRYQSEKAEHQAVRESVGMFDVSHMGEFMVCGKDALAFLNYVLTSNVENLVLHQAQYSLLLNENGGIVDDLIVYYLDEDKFMLCVNAATKEKDWLHLNSLLDSYQVSLKDCSESYAQIALQGKNACVLLKQLSLEPLPERFFIYPLQLFGLDTLVARTGYTGEDGFEIFVKNEDAPKLWQKLYESGKDFSLMLCGLAARDSLRLEAGLLLYSQDMDESISPLEARLMFAVDMNKADFFGKEALLRQKHSGVQKKLMGFWLSENGLARHGFKVLSESLEEIGKVTSAGYSSSNERSYGLAYIKEPYAKYSKNIIIDIRGRYVKATMVRPPFYDISD